MASVADATAGSRAQRAKHVREAFEASRTYEAADSLGGTGALGLTVLRDAVRLRGAMLSDAVAEAASVIRRCQIPFLLSHFAFLVGIGVLMFGNTLVNLGASDRAGGAFYLIWSREIGTWITAMIVAGLVGSAITADIGARRIREELDALAVLGVDRVRMLVVPRVVAVTIATPVLALVSLLWINALDYVLLPWRFGITHGVFFASLRGSIYAPDLLMTVVIKNTIIGFFVGIVACHKGLTCKLGAEGVGRATAQTVVITYFGIWAFNSFFNLAYLTLFPGASLTRG